MRILFTYFVPSGGVETVNRFRAHALRQVGIDSHLLYLHDGAGRQNIRDIPLFVTNDNADMQAILNTYQYDAIVCVCDHLMLQRLRGLGYAGPLLYEAQGLGSREQAFGTLHAASLFIRMYASGVLTSETPHLMEICNELLSDYPRFYMKNLLDTDLFSYRPAPWINPTQAPVLAWVGRIERNKNWLLYLQIAAILVERYPLLQLWMFEDANIYEPDERASFEAVLDRLSLRSRLILRSNIPHDHMPYYYSAIGDSGGLLVSTSHIESFGYAIAEAMSCRCPVLTTDSDGVRGTVIQDVTGGYFDGTPLGGSQASVRLIEDAALRMAVRLQGEAYIRETFSFSRYAASFNSVMIALGIRPPG